MSQFMFFAALIALIAVAFAISMLWQRSRALALSLAIGLPLAAGLVYLLKGEPAALDPANTAAPATMEDAVVLLEKRVAEEPNDADGVILLARSYASMEKFDLARDTYARAMKLKPDDSDLSVEYVGALLRASADHRFTPEAVRLLEKALEKNPGNQQALFFLGMDHMQHRRAAEAAATWEKLLPLLAPSAEDALRPQVESARSAAGLPPLPPQETQPFERMLNIAVSVDPKLLSQVMPGDFLYVYARAPDGTGPPVAVKRIVIKELPMTLWLSDEDSPMPTAALSSYRRVQLMARLSKSGDVMPTKGDLEADPMQITVDGKQPVTLVLRRTVP